MEKVQFRFHRIFSSFIIPLNLFIGVYSLLTAVRNCIDEGMSTLNIIALVESIVVLTLVIFTYRGLIRLKRYSLITLIALMAVKAADNIWAIVLSLRSSHYSYTVSAALGIVFSVLVSVYYLKRRSFFSKEGVTVIRLKREDVERLRARLKIEEGWKEEKKEEIEEEVVPEYDCPRCGFHITDGAVFCPKCGSQTRKVNH